MRDGHDGELQLSASDLVRHLGCRHLTELERAAAEGRVRPPHRHDPALEQLQQRGLAHEAAYVESLRARGLGIADLRDGEGSETERTLAAMRDGADAIVQAGLRDGRWFGRADVLLRVPEPSGLGDWSYEIVDTKLARDTRAGTVLQLCLYSDLLGTAQGRLPARMHVVKPGEGLPRETYRYADFQAYYRLVRTQLESVLAGPPSADTYPDPVPHCDICRWWAHCDARRRADDHLCLVAGIHKLHIEELHRQSVNSLEALADRASPLDRPARGHPDAYRKVQAQAAIQLRGRREGQPVYDLLAPEAARGLQRLPAPDDGDVFFDIESARFVEDGGLEYLLGVAHGRLSGPPEYTARWGLSRAQEKASVDWFIDLVMQRWRVHPGMHIYHFGHYEPSAVKRLVGRHATREAQLDQLLRAGRFVDLHAVTRQGLRASVERYSLKDLEPFFGFTRQVDLRSASAALRRVQNALELERGADVLDEDRAGVEAYNRDDCLATAGLRAWLEDRRRELAGRGVELARPEAGDGQAGENIVERQAEVQQVYDALVDGLPEAREDWTEPERARWLLAHLLDYFRREDRCVWWDYFRMHELDPDELLEERQAIAGLRFVGEIDGGTARCPVHRYTFPPQEATLSDGNRLEEVGAGKIGTVFSIDYADCTLDIKKRKDSVAIHPASVLVDGRIDPQLLDRSLLEFARSVVANGIDGNGPFKAGRDLLRKARPRLADPVDGPLRRDGEPVVDAATRLARALDSSVLPIQGPPGTGKTFTGAGVIARLIGDGKRVGVTAVSHKVIVNLIDKTIRAAREIGAPIEAVHKGDEPDDATPADVAFTNDNAAALAALDDGKLVGGTVWLWSRDDAVETLDYLFVDEAGQMSLANVLAAARPARNLVLLGDPQQLEQPQRGAHPEGAEVAALVHVLAGHDTIAADRGLFLDETWRLHPSICTFTSEVYYEGRLRSRAGLERQALAGETPFAGSGLFYVPVVHAGNQNRSDEEVDAIEKIVNGLLQSRITWTDATGAARRLDRRDILIVAPYNAQVGALAARLAGFRVGTVDKFQGQEAPVVIYSMTSSSIDDAPRGMTFLFNPNRLNVATSRARCTCILVAAPALMEPECNTVSQMRWANGMCRFRELAGRPDCRQDV